MRILGIITILNFFCLTEASSMKVSTPYSEVVDQQTSHHPHVQLMENPATMERGQTFERVPSLLKRFKGTITKGAAIATGTFIGGLIGFGIVSGEYSFDAGLDLIKMGMPIYIGSAIGCAAGCVGGYFAKRSILYNRC